jgi:hypothetical protein
LNVVRYFLCVVSIPLTVDLVRLRDMFAAREKLLSA